jgi:hypothetical protein
MLRLSFRNNFIHINDAIHTEEVDVDWMDYDNYTVNNRCINNLELPFQHIQQFRFEYQ